MTVDKLGSKLLFWHRHDVIELEIPSNDLFGFDPLVHEISRLQVSVQAAKHERRILEKLFDREMKAMQNKVELPRDLGQLLMQKCRLHPNEFVCTILRESMIDQTTKDRI
jgi:hypothetical protein